MSVEPLLKRWMAMARAVSTVHRFWYLCHSPRTAAPRDRQTPCAVLDHPHSPSQSETECTHAHTCTPPPPPPPKKRTTKTWKTQTRPQRTRQKSETLTPPSPRPTQYKRDKRKDIILTDCSAGTAHHLLWSATEDKINNSHVWTLHVFKLFLLLCNLRFRFLARPRFTVFITVLLDISFALKNLIFLAEATGIGSTADDVEGRGSGESLFRYWLVLLWSSFFFPTLPALAEFVDCSKLCPCLFLAFSTTKSSLNLWNTTISCKTSKRRVKSKWPAQQASANHNVRFRHVTRFSQSLYKGLNSATSVWGCFRQLNLGSCYWNWATVIVRFFLSKMSGGLPGFVEYN